jgi:hypothetical protein
MPGPGSRADLWHAEQRRARRQLAADRPVGALFPGYGRGVGLLLMSAAGISGRSLRYPGGSGEHPDTTPDQRHESAHQLGGTLARSAEIYQFRAPLEFN